MSKRRKAIITRAGDIGIVEFANVAYTFEIAASGSDRKPGINIASPGILPLMNAGLRDSMPLHIGPFKIVPNGNDNNFPYDLREILEDNNLSEGVFKRQRGLLWGLGPRLFKREIVDGQENDVLINDAEITDWLKSWNYSEYLRRSVIDFYHTEGVFTKYYLTRAWRIGDKPMIAKIEHAGYENCRLEWPDDLYNPQGVIFGDWLRRRIMYLTRYPMMDELNPYANPVSMQYNSIYSYARKFYGVPAYYGAISWIKRGSAIPKVLEALTKNSLNIKWHIKSPSSYWDNKREILRNQCILKGENYNEQMLEDLKDDIFSKLAEVLSGEVNVGKFFTSEKCMNEMGQMENWEIEAIDQKVKAYIDAQLSISKHADGEIVAGLGLHPSLSNIIIDGKLASGSELLYAYKVYVATEVAMPEEVILHPINFAIELNFPGRQTHMGFYRPIIKTEDTTTPADRIKNKV